MDGVRGMVEEIIRFKIIEIATRAKRGGGDGKVVGHGGKEAEQQEYSVVDRSRADRSVTSGN